MVVVGTGKPNAFYDIDDNTNQIGTALQIFPGTNTNTYLIYYRDADQTIKRWSTDQSNTTVTLAHYVTNLNVFTAQDYAGQTLTNNMFTRVIQIILQFSQDNATNSKYGGLNDFFQVRTKATRRK